MVGRRKNGKRRRRSRDVIAVPVSIQLLKCNYSPLPHSSSKKEKKLEGKFALYGMLLFVFFRCFITEQHFFGKRKIDESDSKIPKIRFGLRCLGPRTAFAKKFPKKKLFGKKSCFGVMPRIPAFHHGQKSFSFTRKNAPMLRRYCEEPLLLLLLRWNLQETKDPLSVVRLMEEVFFFSFFPSFLREKICPVTNIAK